MDDPIERRETTLTPSDKDPLEDANADIPQTPEVIL